MEGLAQKIWGTTRWRQPPVFSLNLLRYKCCDIVGLLQESKRPLPGKLRKKSEKGIPGASRPRGRKNPKKSIFQVFFSSFRPVFQPFFDSFFELSRPGNPFSDFFGSFLGRGLFDSCRRPTMSRYKWMCTVRAEIITIGAEIFTLHNLPWRP